MDNLYRQTTKIVDKGRKNIVVKGFSYAAKMPTHLKIAYSMR